MTCVWTHDETIIVVNFNMQMREPGLPRFFCVLLVSCVFSCMSVCLRVKRVIVSVFCASVPCVSSCLSG